MAIQRLTGAIAHGTIGQVAPITTGAIDTTGATLLVAFTGNYHGYGDVTDSLGNTWHQLTWTPDTGNACAIHYAYDHGGTALSVGAGHTFTFTPGYSYASVIVTAYSGTLATASVFVDSSSADGSLTTGAATPSASGDLAVAMCSGENGTASVSSGGVTIFDTIGSSSEVIVAAADAVLGSTSDVNVTFTGLGGGTSSYLAIFKAAAGGGSPSAAVLAAAYAQQQ